MKTLIIVEGQEDVFFMTHLLKHVLCKKDSNYEIFENGSCGIKEDNVSLIKQKIKTECHTVVIINDQDGVYPKRLKTVLNRLKQIYPNKSEDILKKHIFLYPENVDSSKQTISKKEKYFYLESLLFKCAKSNKQYILDCYTSMQKCMKSNPDSKKLDIPDHHNKAYVYANVHFTKTERKNRNREKEDSKKIGAYGYHRDDIWDFKSKALQPLLDFLKTHVK